MMKNDKRGQAALEFLTTYGWAFLVILVMIGALGYFGILNPSRFLPDRCSVNPQFACDDAKIGPLTAGAAIGTQSRVMINLVNNVGHSITVDKNDFSAVDDGISASFCRPGFTVNISQNPAHRDLRFKNAVGFPAVGYNSPVDIPSGVSFSILCLFNETEVPFIIGEKSKVLFSGSYLPEGKTFKQPFAVEVYSTIS